MFRFLQHQLDKKLDFHILFRKSELILSEIPENISDFEDFMYLMFNKTQHSSH